MSEHYVIMMNFSKQAHYPQQSEEDAGGRLNNAVFYYFSGVKISRVKDKSNNGTFEDGSLT